MGVISSKRSLWFSAMLIVICLWTIFRNNIGDEYNSRVQDVLNLKDSKGSWGMKNNQKPPGKEQKPTGEAFGGSPKSPEITAEKCQQAGFLEPAKVDGKEKDCPAPPLGKGKVTAEEDRPLIMYAYYESPFARANLQFFIDHALHGAADFLFVLNGETDADKTVIFNTTSRDARGPKRSMANIMVRKRENACYDLGSHAEVLNSVVGGEGWSNSEGKIPAPKGAPAPFTYKRPPPPTAEQKAAEDAKTAMENMSLEEKQAQEAKKKADEDAAAAQGAKVKRSFLGAVMAEEAAINEQATIGKRQTLVETVAEKLAAVVQDRATDRSANEKALKPLRNRYKRFILMNASIRGPFVPTWSDSCWSDAYLNKVSTKVKIVGMAYNCHDTRGHIQSMIWATDNVGLDVILQPEGIGYCPGTLLDAVDGEIRTTELLRKAGYSANSFMSVYHSRDGPTRQQRFKDQSSLDLKDRTGQENERKLRDELESPGDFWETCHDEDWLYPAPGYFGTFLHPYEVLFMKSHRHIEDTVLDRLTEWHDGMGYDSYRMCK